jgi:DNA-binding MarR family transcriptional regulator
MAAFHIGDFRLLVAETRAEYAGHCTSLIRAHPTARDRRQQFKPKSAMDIEEQSFRTSILYWIGSLEELANLQFVKEMGGAKSVVARWRTLSVLSELDGATITELSEHTFIERSALSRLLELMEQEGLLKRRTRPGDRRITEVYITRKGTKTFLTMLPVRRDIFKRAAKGLKPHELETLMRNIQHLAKTLRAELDTPGKA